MKHVALFGGSFDPPHLGHQLVATELLARGRADEVWFVPVKRHPLGKVVSPDEHRVAMLELLLEQIADPRVRIEKWELAQSAVSYTIQTLEHWSAKEPETQFSWVMGSDQLTSFDQWYRARELVKNFPIIVYPRPGHDWNKLWPGMIPLTDWPAVAVSSTAARAALANGADTSQLVLPEVAAYSEAHHLYEAK